MVVNYKINTSLLRTFTMMYNKTFKLNHDLSNDAVVWIVYPCIDVGTVL